MPHRTYESLADAAERTKMSVKTLRRRIAAGELPAYRCGSRILRVDPDDVDELMKPLYGRRSRRQASQAPQPWPSVTG